MHPTILVQRKAQAINRIMEKAKALAELLDFDPALIEALQPKGAKDTQVIEMFRLEALANIFDELARAAGVKEPVTAVTPAADESPAGEVEPTAEEAETPIPIAVGPDGLPVPTGEQPVEAIEEEAPAEEAVPEEPEPAAVASKPTKARGKRSKK